MSSFWGGREGERRRDEGRRGRLRQRWAQSESIRAPLDLTLDLDLSPSLSLSLSLPQDLAAKRQAASDAAPSSTRPLNVDVAEAALVERLGAAANSSANPIPRPGNAVHYLAGVFGRADAEARRLPPPVAAASPSVDPVSRANEEWRAVLEHTKQIALTYCGLAALSGAFPSASDGAEPASAALALPSPIVPAKKKAAGPRPPALRLLDMMDAAVALSAGGLAGLAGARLPHGAAAGAPPAPPGFLDAFARRWGPESPEELSDFLSAIAKECGSRLRRSKSPLGEWQPAMRHLLELASSPAAAAALVRNGQWLPLPLVNGAALEKNSLLGPAFAVSIVFSPRGAEEDAEDDDDDEYEDEGPSTWPEEMQQSVGALAAWVDSGDYSDPAAADGVLLPSSSSSSSSSSPLSVAAEAASDKLLRAQGEVRGALRAVLMTLLRSKGENVKERTTAWLTAALNANRERGKLSPDPRRASSAGFALNVEAALLDVCAPFAEQAFRGRRAWGKVRARALADGRVDWQGDTRLALDEPAALLWSRAVRERHRAAAPASSAAPYSYHFVCDAFWAAAKSSTYGSCGVAAQAAQLRGRAAHTDGVARQLDRVAAAVASGGPLPDGVPPIPAGGEAAAARRFATQAGQHRQVAGSMRVYARVLDLGAAGPLLPSSSPGPCSSGPVGASSAASGGGGGGGSGSSAVDFVGLVAAWTMRLAMLGEAAEDEAEEAAAGSGKEPTPSPEVALPLPPPCEAFKALPQEIFSTMSWAMSNAPEDAVCAGCGTGGGEVEQGCGGSALGDVLRCVVALIASPDHVRNPYVRAHLFSLLHSWVVDRGPRVARRGSGENGGAVRLPAARVHSAVLALLDADPLLRTQTVRSTLRLYADIEDTSRNAAFQEKFELRLRASQVLAALWRAPGGQAAGAGAGAGGPQRRAWLEAADEAAGASASAAEVAETVYGRFMHFLLTDAIYLLDLALEKLKGIAAHEKRAAEGSHDGQQQQQQGQGQQQQGQQQQGQQQQGQQGQQQVFSDQEVAEVRRFVPAALDLSAACLDTLRYSTAEPRGAAPWLTRGMVQRTADALNYFLAALVGPARRGLKVRDPAALRWDPKALLVSLATVYVHLAAASSPAAGGADGGAGPPAPASAFAAAVAADARSFSRRLFPDALAVLGGLSLLPQAHLEALERFALVADAAAESADREREAAGSAPDEFVDPITGEVMADPVRLPASGQVVDSSSLARALMSKSVDPFSNTPLRMEEAEALPELAARIREWREGLQKK